MPTNEEMNTILSSYGVSPSVTSGFNMANIIAGIVFGIIGLYAFNYGRKEKAYKPLIIGLALIVFPYFVSNTWVLYLVGTLIASLLYFWKD